MIIEVPRAALLACLNCKKDKAENYMCTACPRLINHHNQLTMFREQIQRDRKEMGAESFQKLLALSLEDKQLQMAAHKYGYVLEKEKAAYLRKVIGRGGSE